MQRIAVSQASAFGRPASAKVGFFARLLSYALLAFGLGGAQVAEADCDPSGVNEPSATSTAEKHFLLNHLGIMYARGRGVPQSAGLAMKLFRQLAMDGYTPAMVNLGTLYERRRDGRRDHRQAYAWIRAALALGVPKEDYDVTLFKLGMIALHLDTGQTTSAERLALAIIDRIGERCEYSRTSYEDTVALSSAP
jgi:hypothetical protein